MNIDMLQREINIQVNEEMTVGNYRAYDFRLVRYIGLEPAILLTYLCDQDKYINKSKVGSEFYKQKKYIEFFTGLTSKQQTLAIKKLAQLEILTVVKKGMPAKNYFRIDYNKVREMKKIVVDEFYGEIEKYDYYKHEFDSDEEILKYANEKALNNSKSSEPETGSQGNRKDSDINNLEINNLDSFNFNSKELNLKGQHETVVHNPDDNIKNNNIEDKNGKEDSKIFSGKADDSASILKTPAAAEGVEKPNKVKGGLGPLYDIVTKMVPAEIYPTLNAALKTYLKAHLGIRRLPSPEKWEDMIRKLQEYASVELSGASGKKFIENRALEIVKKAIDGKDGVPYTDFDDIYDKGLMEPTFELNRDYTKGY